MVIERFIEEQLKGYKEPQKRGKVLSRGETVGFSKQKFHASLMVALTEKSLVHISKKVDVSNGVLRRWNIEKPFKEEIKKNRNQFAEYYLEFIFFQIENLIRNDNFPLRENIPKITSAIRDSEHFSVLVWKEINIVFRNYKNQLRQLLPNLQINKLSFKTLGEIKTAMFKSIKRIQKDMVSILAEST